MKACLCILLSCISVIGLAAHPTPPWQKTIAPSDLQLYLQNTLNTPSTIATTGKPPPGVTLTINPTIENILKTNIYKEMVARDSKWSTGIVLNANDGSVVALTSLSNPKICPKLEKCAKPMQDSAVEPWEPGSDFKPLLLAAAFNNGSIQPDSTYYDQGTVMVGDRLFVDAEHFAPGNISMQSILNLSLNTGAIHVLKSLGDGTVNAKARQIWYSYLIDRYHFGAKTGIELYNEAAGIIRQPSGGRNIVTQYTSSAFGIGETVTPIQLVASYASLVNGGTYYQPHLTVKPPKIVSRNVISEQTSLTMTKMLNLALIYKEPAALTSGYTGGGKSGTAPVSDENGAYKLYVDNGTYVGYLGSSKPEYIMLVRFDEPHTTGFASSVARKVWANIFKQLIDANQLQR